MKRIISVIALLVLFVSFLDASYYRSIRVSAFVKKSDVEKFNKKLNKFIASKKNILKYKKKIGFKTKVIKVGRYYMSVIEPFKDQTDVLQEILDTLRVKYPKVYVRKIKVKDGKKTKEKIVAVKQPYVEVVKPKQILIKNKKIVKKEKKNLIANKKTAEGKKSLVAINSIKNNSILNKEEKQKKKQKKEIKKVVKVEQNITKEKVVVKDVQVKKVIDNKKDELNITANSSDKNKTLIIATAKNNIKKLKEENNTKDEVLEATKETDKIIAVKESIKKEEVKVITKKEDHKIVHKDKKHINKNKESDQKSIELTKSKVNTPKPDNNIWLIAFVVTFLILVVVVVYFTFIKKPKKQLIQLREDISVDNSEEIEKLKNTINELENRLSLKDGELQKFSSIIEQLKSSSLNKDKLIQENNVLMNKLEDTISQKDDQIVKLLKEKEDLKNKDVVKLEKNSEPKKEQEKEVIVEPKENIDIDTTKVVDEYPELEVSAGIAKCSEDEELYISMLDDFKESYEMSTQKLNELCENNQFDDARHYAQEIKDFAVHIGAYNLCESVASIEYEFEKEYKDGWQKLLDSYNNNLEGLLKNIDEYKLKSKK